MGGPEEVRIWVALSLVTALLLVSVTQAETNGDWSYGASRLKEYFTHDEEEWMNSRGECGVSLRQGRRRYQEDRVICIPKLLLPGPGGCVDHGIQVGLFGVFDGHNGAEASELASTYLPHLLRYHTWYIATHGINEGLKNHRTTTLRHERNEKNVPKYANAMLDWKFQKKCKQMEFSKVLYRMILKEALTRTLSDLDSALTNDQSTSGSTAVVVLKVERKLLVANIGDSKAFICSSFSKPETNTCVQHNDTSEIESNSQGYLSLGSVKELTVDQRPDRLDEKNRIESTGGFVSMWDGVARVNGQLAVSRAIGDVPLKRYGVISEPEFTDWQNLTTEDLFLVITSDGILETMNTEDVCTLIYAHLQAERSYESVVSQTLADFIVDMAFTNGSSDNLAAIVYLLNSSDIESNTTDHSSIQIWSGMVTDNEGGHLIALEEEGHCYELIERFPTSVVLPLELSGTSPSSAIIGELLSGRNTNGSSLPHRTGYFGNVQLYQESVICLRRPVLSETDELCMNPEMFSKYMRLIGSVHETEINSTRWGKISDPDERNIYVYSRVHERYVLTKHIGRGSFGEVWSAMGKPCSGDIEYASEHSDQSLHQHEFLHLDCENTNLITIPMKKYADSQEASFVIKRIQAERGEAVYLSGIREQYFGKLFLKARRLRDMRPGGTEDELEHVVRYIESFEVNAEGDLWLVFRNEGYSLSSMLYTADKSMERGNIRILEPSKWWKWLRTTKDGQREMRSVLYQLLQAVKACHDRNITHRDIKPENMMVRATSRCLTLDEADEQLEYPCNLSMRLIDFGSAVDTYSYQNLYGTKGPSRAEQTEEYTPPESFMQSNWLKTYAKYATRYDIWSIGVIMLELILGTPHVFQISGRTRALIDQQLDGWGSSARETAYMLRALMEMCILYPINTNLHRPVVKSDNSDLASWKCTEENLMQQIKERDPLGIGLEDVWALRLLRGLLQWYPEDRMTVEDAMKHPFFHPHLQGRGDKL